MGVVGSGSFGPRVVMLEYKPCQGKLVTVVMAVTDKQKVWGIVGGEEPLLMEMR
jgi:hypothetical protein